eukprot:TRINITY_DN8164_c0_g1_i1.p1 TRINITY_DN8164_c0_g1~~TRINITY_DN8164_c0_g1_i1.p1  ORF type:complete len:238 (+),score=39.65 TRINITY_DN8164_c0_g1_i1:48-761(+)
MQQSAIVGTPIGVEDEKNQTPNVPVSNDKAVAGAGGDDGGVGVGGGGVGAVVDGGTALPKASSHHVAASQAQNNEECECCNLLCCSNTIIYMQGFVIFFAFLDAVAASIGRTGLRGFTQLGELIDPIQTFVAIGTLIVLMKCHAGAVPKGCEYCCNRRSGSASCPCIPWALVAFGVLNILEVFGSVWEAIHMKGGIVRKSMGGFGLIDFADVVLFLIIGKIWLSRFQRENGYWCCRS